MCRTSNNDTEKCGSDEIERVHLGGYTYFVRKIDAVVLTMVIPEESLMDELVIDIATISASIILDVIFSFDLYKNGIFLLLFQIMMVRKEGLTSRKNPPSIY